MTNQNNQKSQLDLIRDLLVEDITEATDEEILAETEEELGEAKQEASRLRELVSGAVFEHGKSRFEAAKKERLQKQEQRQGVLNVNSIEHKKQIINAVNANDNLKQKVTMAARGEDQLSERDLDTTLKYLYELGVIDEDGNVLCEDD